MAVRTSMSAELIPRVRRYIGDLAGANQHFSDQDIQDQLDEYKKTVRYAPLRPGPTLSNGALYNYLDYYSDAKNWEADEVLQWSNFAVLTPATSDRIDGHWTFSLAAPGQYPPVYITGKFYDLYAASADLLEQWAAALIPTTYDFATDGQKFNRSAIVTNMRELAMSYRRKAMARVTKARRSDLAGEPGHSGLSYSMGGPGDVSGGN